MTPAQIKFNGELVAYTIEHMAATAKVSLPLMIEAIAAGGAAKARFNELMGIALALPEVKARTGL